MAVKASNSITLSSVIDVKATYRYYLLQSSTLTTPARPTTYPPSSSWDDTEPTYTEGSTNSLYIVDCTVFCDDTFSYSAVSMSSSYEAAKAAYNKAQNAQDTANSVKANTIYGVDVQYALSTSSTTAPTSGWSTTAPAWTSGKYMWQKTVVTYGDGSTEETAKTCITGATGQTGAQGAKGDKGDTGATGSTGATGNGVTSIVERYYQSSSATALSGGSWSTTVPTWTDGKYIWTKSVITYTNGTTAETTAVCVTGSKGATGAQGAKGDKGDKGDTGATGATGATGTRGTGIYKVTTAPSSYTTATGGFTPTYRIALSTVKSQSGATGIIVGDFLVYSYYMYPVGYVDSSYVYLGTRVSIRGATGATGSTGAAGANGQMLYATCSTAEGTVAKVATLGAGSITLTAGVSVCVYFSNKNTASSPTLNVNSTGAKAIRVNGAAITSPYYWQAKNTVTFVYDGTYWVMADSTANNILANWCYNNDKSYVNGAIIAAGTITAKQISVEDLSALNATLGGWSVGNYGLYNDDILAGFVNAGAFRLYVGRYTYAEIMAMSEGGSDAYPYFGVTDAGDVFCQNLYCSSGYGEFNELVASSVKTFAGADLDELNTNFCTYGTANSGEYYKFYDGTLICTKSVTWSSVAHTTAWGNMYETAYLSLGNWPLAFSAKPNVTAVVVDLSGAFIEHMINTTVSSAGQVCLARPNSGTSNFKVHVTGVGRWK